MFEFSRSKHLNLAGLHKKGGKLFHRNSKKRFKRFKKIITSSLAWSGIIIFIVFLVLLIYLLVGIIGLRTAYEASLMGGGYLGAAGTSFSAGDYREAKNKALMATNKFKQARTKIASQQEDKIWQMIPGVKNELGGLTYFFSSAELFSQALGKLSLIGTEIEENLEPVLSIEGRSLDDRKNLLSIIYEYRPEIIGAQANLELALALLDNAGQSRMAKMFSDDIKTMEAQILQIRSLVDRAVPMAELIPEILGYPGKASYLVIFQDQGVLWPTGGKITAYGIMEAESGRITSFQTMAASGLDDLTQGRLSIYAPSDLADLKGTEEWLFRESNWEVDWPIAAGQIKDIFKWRNDSLARGHSKRINIDNSFAGVITLNQAVLRDWLSYTGPVVVNGTVYHEGNIANLISSESTTDKEILGPIVNSLYLDLENSSVTELKQVLSALYSHILKKNILLYYTDETYNEILDKYGLYNSINNTEYDYLMVADTNLSANIRNSEIDRSIDYILKQDVNGLFTEARLNYSYQGKFDLEKENYRVHTRVLVPEGSLLVRTEGIDINKVTQTQEYSKTVFAVTHEVRPGVISNILFRYKLSESIEEKVKEGEYRLYIQKQAGAEDMHCNIELDFKRDIRSYMPIGFFVNHQDNRIKFKSDLDTDKEYKIYFY